MLLRTKLAAVVLALLSPLCYADAAAELKNLLGQSRTLQARFEQSVRSVDGELVQQSSGDIALARPNQFRWHSTAPFDYLIVGNGEVIWRYDADLEQLDIEPFDSQLADTPALIFSASLSELSAAYQIVEITDARDTTRQFLLSPKVDSLFSELRLHFRAGQLAAMSLVDNLQQQTAIRFVDARYNLQLAPSLFEFDPKKHES